MSNESHASVRDASSSLRRRAAHVRVVCATVAFGASTAVVHGQTSEVSALASPDAIVDTARVHVERVGENIVHGRFARLIEGLHVQLKAFERDSDGTAGLGFSYDFAKSLLDSEPHGTDAFEFVANGNIAFDRDGNPDNYLWTALRVHWFGAPRDDSQSAVVWDSELHAGIESNQDFSSHQGVFGGSFGGRLISSSPDSGLSRFDVFDIPAATLRWLAGQDEHFRLSGEAYPSIVAGLDVVDAAHDDTRDALTDDESLFRFRFEASLRSRALRVADEPLYLSAGWRVYQEIDAPAGVRRADTDEASHLQVRLDLPKGWSLTYAAGKLPLDARDDSTFALGFDVQF